ncbi:MAG: FixH family protein [Gammaproteobacteria bacterium]|nr:FixH family protein [Gammaproteobacteria bacterium]
MTIAWYRQFWPWFLIALPTAAVLAGILTLFIAAKNPDLLIQRSEDERIGPVIFEPGNNDRANQIK